ncbi:hypothetical protein VCHA38P217_40234 [Vibrio chagasii]|nr:hypothetical protein VCHA34P120_240011 [Vibrio chagasii]CAH7445327.1 hypothetical protein VCHA38P217_40234 [Vibrio chagasii]
MAFFLFLGKAFFYVIVFIDNAINSAVAYCWANIDQKIFIANINDICFHSRIGEFIN